MYWFKGKRGGLFTFQLKWSESVSASPSAEAGSSSERSFLQESTGKQRVTQIWQSLLLQSWTRALNINARGCVHACMASHRLEQMQVNTETAERGGIQPLAHVALLSGEVMINMHSQSLIFDSASVSETRQDSTLADVCIGVCQHSCMSGWHLHRAAVSHYWSQSSRGMNETCFQL